MTDFAAFLRKCAHFSRERQSSALFLLEPTLKAWPKEDSLQVSSIIVVSTWSECDADALVRYYELARRRKSEASNLTFLIAFTDWFDSKASISAATGYSGPLLQSPFLVLRDAGGKLEWAGEGYAARRVLLDKLATG